MLKRALLKLVRRNEPAVPLAPLTPVERRTETREAVFREAVITVEGLYTVRAIIKDISEGGARIEFATRIDLPGRIVIAEPLSGMKRWARVAWQHDGAAGLEFQEEA
ncbi:MAG: PilZ domain-containing protein [Hyphomonadaceae bacterium]|nr:PilZ domain-containing protein [Hyphomonadaceae bacterium]